MGTQGLNLGMLQVKGISDMYKGADDTSPPAAFMKTLTFIKIICQKHREALALLTCSNTYEDINYCFEFLIQKNI